MIMKSKKANEIFLTVSPVYENSNIMKSTFEAIGEELDTTNEYAEEVKKQLFPQTATWGLDIWEQRLGLVTNRNKSLEKRRGKVIAKLQSNYIITPERMATIIKNYTGANVLIDENIAPYTFKVTVDIDDIQDNRELNRIVKKVKPSHLYWIPEFILNFYTEDYFNVYVTNRFFLNFRGNIPLNLDGSWLLNGVNKLTGYEIYFEPLEMRTRNRFFSYKETLFSLVTNLNLSFNNKEKFDLKETNRIFLNFRGNIPLILDGSWVLNGKNSLSGYEIETYQEPFKIKHTNKFFLYENNNVNIITLIQSKNVLTSSNEYASTNAVNIKSRIDNTLKNVNKTCVRQIQSTSSKLRTEKNLWFLDGSLSLDGNKLLNAQVIEEVL